MSVVDLVVLPDVADPVCLMRVFVAVAAVAIAVFVVVVAGLDV